MEEAQDNPLESVLERAIDEIDGDEVSFGAILDLFGDRSFGPVIALLSLLVIVPPLGAIPGLPVIVGLMIILFCGQIIFGAKHIWVPGFIEKRSIPKDKLRAADKRARPWLKRIDNLISERFDVLTSRWSVNLAAIVVIFLALLMIPLEFVPFAVAIPGSAILLFGLAFVARDGVLMLLGYGVTFLAAYVTISFVPWEKVLSLFGG